MAVSIPFDLADSALHLDKGFSKIYQHHLISRLKKKMIDKFKNGHPPINLMEIEKWNNFYTFDHNVTAMIHGFKSADDYYNKSSSKQFLSNISRSCLSEILIIILNK